MAVPIDQLKDGFLYFIQSHQNNLALTAYEAKDTNMVFGAQLQGAPNGSDSKGQMWIARNIALPDTLIQWQFESALTGTVLCFENEENNLQLGKSNTTDFKQLWRLESPDEPNRGVSIINLGFPAFCINMAKGYALTEWGMPVFPRRIAENAKTEQWKFIQVYVPDASTNGGPE